jgi:hypothetical protein
VLDALLDESLLFESLLFESVLAAVFSTLFSAGADPDRSLFSASRAFFRDSEG